MEEKMAAFKNLAEFQTTNAINHTRFLSVGIGTRVEGTDKEKRAAEYIAAELQKAGYAVRTQQVPVPNGTVSQNIIATKEGFSARRLVIGAHYDAKGDSPGANDNASGVGVLLELARAARVQGLTPTIDFIAFGAEERIDENPDHHHYGSRHYVSSLSAAERDQVVGMITIDMVGAGSTFSVGSLEYAPRVVAERIIAVAERSGIETAYFKSAELSDHEPFEKAGVPSAWVQWKPYPYTHSPDDSFDKLDPSRMETAGRVLLDFLRDLDSKALRSLR
jgi:Zn-dependent M28 family amino/carboxypeptidase